MTKNQKTKTKITRKQAFIFIALAILVISGVIFALYQHSKKQDNSKQPAQVIKTIPDKSSNTPSTNSTTSSSSNTSTQGRSTDKSSTGSQTNSNIALISPYGSFVSNHYPGENGSDTKEQSQCVTSPGATCYIKFTLGSVVKTLPEKTADQSGSIFWEWDINDAGLTSGSWKIEAVAKLGGKTESTTDQLKLEVK